MQIGNLHLVLALWFIQRSGQPIMYIQMDAAHKLKRHCFSHADFAATEQSASSSGSATASEHQISDNRVNVLASQLRLSASAVARESEILSELISDIGLRIDRYKQMLASMQSTVQEAVYVSEGLEMNPKENGNTSSANMSHLDATPCRTNSVHEYPRHTPVSPQASRQDPLQTPAIIPTLPGPNRTLQLPTISNVVPQKHFSGKIGKTKPAIPAAKRPLSDFNFFCRDARKLVVEAHPEYTKEQVNKELGRIWSMLDCSSRQHYRRMYVQDKQRYSSDVAAMDGSMSAAVSKSRPYHPALDSAVAANIRPLCQGASYEAAGDNIVHNTDPGRCSASSRVKTIIWKHAKEPVSEETPNRISSLVSAPIYTSTALPNLQEDSQPGATDLLHTDEHTCNYSVTHSRGNTIESILNDVCNFERLGNTGEPDDLDEPLARSLAGNGSRCSIYAVQEHRLRETISAPAGSIKGKI